MKRIIKYCLSLLLLVCTTFFITACSKDDVDVDTIMTNAANYIYNMYVDEAGSVTDSFEVTNMTKSGANTIDLTWNYTVVSGSEDAIKLTKKNDQFTEVYVGYYDGKVLEKTTFTLEPTLSFKGVTKKLSDIIGQKGIFTFTTDVFIIGDRDDWNALANDKNTIINIKGVIIDVIQSGSSVGSFYFQDEEGFGYYAYKPANAYTTGKDSDGKTTYNFKIKAGDVVVVTGKRSDYSGQQEFGEGCTFHIYEGETKAPIAVDGTEDWASWASNAKYTDKYQNNYIKLTGCKPLRVEGSYYYFTVGNGKAEYNIYDSYYFLTDAQRNAFKEAWNDAYANGATLDIEGISTVYSSKIQIYGSTFNPTIIEAKGAMNDTEKVAATIAEVEQAIPAYLAESKDITLPNKGRFNSVTVNWEVLTTSEYVKIEEGKLKVTLNAALPEFEVKVTCTSGTISDSKTIKVTMVNEFTSVKDFLTAKDQENVVFLKGYVVAANGSSTEANSFVLDDGTGAIFSYNKFAVALGDEVIVAAKYSENYKLPQLGTVALVKVVSQGNSYRGTVAGAIDKDNFEEVANAYKADDVAAITQWAGKLIKVTAYLVDKDTYTNLYVENDNTSKQVASLYFNNTIKTEQVPDLKGTEVDVYGYVRGFNKDGMITLQVQAILAKGASYVEPEHLLTVTAEAIEAAETGTVESSYFDGDPRDYELDGYTINLSGGKTAAYGFKYMGSLRYVQLKANAGTLTIENIKAKTITITLINTNDFGDNQYKPLFKFGGEDINPTKTGAEINAARVDTGEKNGDKNVYAYRLVFEVNASEAKDFEIKAASGAVYILSIVID